MNRSINGFNSIKLQVENSRQDVAVPNGIAISNGRYDVLLTDAVEVPKLSMQKNGTQSIGDAWMQLTSWTAGADTTLSNNAIVIPTAFYGMVKFFINYAVPASFFTKVDVWLRIKINGTVVQTIRYNSIKKDRNAVFFVANFVGGDIVTVESRYYQEKKSFFAAPVITPGTVSVDGTYVTIEKYDRQNQDFIYDLVYSDSTAFVSVASAQGVGPDYGKKQPEFYDARVSGGDGTTNASISKDKGHTWGPVLAQSRMPMPVEAGWTVDFKGKFNIRRMQQAQKDKFDNNTAVNIRFALWGVSHVNDEYETGERKDRELIWDEFLLQGSNSGAGGYVDFDITGHTPVVVPDDIKEVYFTCALKSQTTDEYVSAKYKDTGGGIQSNAYFAIDNNSPLKVMVDIPNEHRTYEHPLSTTGVAFKNRKFFTNMTQAKQLTFFGAPNAAVTINVYEYSSSRGSLIGTYTANVNERKQVTLSSNAGGVEVVGSEYYIESVKPISYDSLNETQTSLEKIEWIDIHDELSGVVATREEFNLGKMQLKFVSDNLASGAAIMPGRRCRLLIVNYGTSLAPTAGYVDIYSDSYGGAESYEPAFTGTIRDFKTLFDYKNRPFIEVTVEDAYRALQDTDGHYLYDLPIEYAPMLNGLGKSSIIDGVDVSGLYQANADSSKNLPSAYVDGMKVKDSLEAMRNTNKGYVFVDRYDNVTYKSALPVEQKLVIADHFARSDISYGRIEKKTDSAGVINKVKPNEYKLDFKNIADMYVSADMPPNVEGLQSMQQISNWWYDQASLDAYGEREATFPVVRGTGQLNDVKLGILGSGFHDWADAIMDDYVLAQNRISRLMLVPNSFYDLKRFGALEIFDPIMVLYKNESHVVFIRKMEWTIVDNSVRLELYFDRSDKGVAWTPVVATGDLMTDIMFDLF